MYCLRLLGLRDVRFVFCDYLKVCYLLFLFVCVICLVCLLCLLVCIWLIGFADFVVCVL